MAPFARGARVTRGRGGSSFRGRGGNFPRGRGAIRGKRPTFHSTRVEEPEAENSDHSQASDSEHPEAVEEVLGVDSSESDIEESAATTKPYNALLQSLSRESNVVQPPRKKRKVALDDGLAQQSNGNEQAKSVQLSVQEDIDHVEEAEQGDNLPLDDMDGAESLDDVENGTNSPMFVKATDLFSQLPIPLKSTWRQSTRQCLPVASKMLQSPSW
jgi:hypothetical protein